VTRYDKKNVECKKVAKLHFPNDIKRSLGDKRQLDGIG